jgi:hypothetical protein
MAFRRRHDFIVIAALVLMVIAYGSFRSEFRLRPDMPIEFFDSSSLPKSKRASEEKIAAAYWDCAVKQVQWKYGYASRLPDEPPPEFSISESQVGPVASNEAVRRQYWQKLHVTWNVSSAWDTQYGLNSISFRQWLRSMADSWAGFVRSVMGR